jgi:excinuclease ABC subunit B
MEGARIIKKEKKNKKNLDAEYDISEINYRNIGKEIKKIDKLMRQSAKELDFEKAAYYRDLVNELKEKILINKA